MKYKILFSLIFIVILTFLIQVFSTHQRYANMKNEYLATTNNLYENTQSNSGDNFSSCDKDLNTKVDSENKQTNTFVKPYGTEKSKIQNFKMTYQLKYESGESSYSSLVNMTKTEILRNATLMD